VGSEKHPSKKTRERAYILTRNAKQLSIGVGDARYAPNHDFMSFWFTNNIDYLLVFCMPSGYLAELWQDKDGVVTTSYLGITNIRVLLSHLKKLGYTDVDTSLRDADIDGYIGDEDGTNRED
jgi:hypothetical protein